MIQEIPTIQEWLKKKPAKKDEGQAEPIVEETPTIQEWITKKRERADQQRPPVMPLKTRDTKPPEPVEPAEPQAEEIPTDVHRIQAAPAQQGGSPIPCRIRPGEGQK